MSLGTSPPGMAIEPIARKRQVNVLEPLQVLLMPPLVKLLVLGERRVHVVFQAGDLRCTCFLHTIEALLDCAPEP